MRQSSRSKWTLCGLIEAPVEQAWEALLESYPYLSSEDKRLIAREDGLQRFTTTSGYARIRLEVDRQRRSIADQGEWWYRGVLSVEPHARGSLLAYRVYNIAPDATRWLVPLVIHRFEPQMQDRLQHVLQAIGTRLNCPTTLFPAKSSL